MTGTILAQRLETRVAYRACEACAAPLDDAQRYCVECGRRNPYAADPAARYLQDARHRSVPTGPPRAGGDHSLGTALAVAVVPLAVAAGLLIGRSGAGDDAKVIAAIRAQADRVVTVAAPAAAAASTPAGVANPSRPTRPAPARVLSATSKGTAHQIAGAPVTAGQKAAGAQIVQRISHQIGGSYTASQQGLPDQIAVP
jgi:hypothetical protein